MDWDFLDGIISSKNRKFQLDSGIKFGTIIGAPVGFVYGFKKYFNYGLIQMIII